MGAHWRLAETGRMLALRPTLLAAAVTCAVLAVPAIASAKDFCVGAPAGCTGAAVPAAGLAATLAEAAINGSDDRVFLGTATFDAGALSYNSLDKLELIGAGAGKSVLRSSAGGPVLTLGGNPESKVSGLTAQVMAGANAGLELNGPSADGVTVDVAPGATINIAVRLDGGARFSHGTLEMNQDAPAVASVDTGTVLDSSIKAPHGTAITAAGSELTVRRSTLDARVGVLVGKGHVTVSDTLVDLRGKLGVGVAAGNNAGFGGMTIGAELDHLTIVGSMPSNSDVAGILSMADVAGANVTVKVRDSVISGVGIPLARLGLNSGVANISTDRSDYLGNVATGFDVGPGSTTAQRRLTASPRFADAAMGDFNLAPASPLIDAGDPAMLPAGAADHDGRPRASDGDGNCSHVPDVGAFEFQGDRAKAVATAAAATARTGQAVAFASAGSCIPGPGAARATWRFDDGARAGTASATHAFATPGRHAATLTVTDDAGHSATATAVVDVTAAPALSGLAISPSRIAIGKSLPKLVSRPAKRPTGTISFRLSGAAKVELRFAKRGKGGKFRRLEARIRVAAKPGLDRVRFAGRLSRRVRLAPGTYRLTAAAVDATGARSAPVRTRFVAVRSR
jgi:hypothetical protein